MSSFSWQLPAPAAGATSEDSVGGVLYRRDIWLDLSAATGPDTAVNNNGDWVLVDGREGLRQALLRRFLTNPGEWATNPGYGAGARLFVKAKNTRTNRDDLASRLRSQALAEARVESVSEINVVPMDGVDGLRIRVVVVPKGAAKRGAPLTVAFEVN